MSKKFFEDLLASFKRSNKDRKQKLAEKAGYKTPEEYKTFLENSISNTTSKVQEKEVKSDVELTDMVIAFDSTGSMMTYLESVKKHVVELVPNLFAQNPNLNISIVVFGDYCDMKDLDKSIFGKAYQCLPLTNDVNKIINFVKNSVSTSGGDEDEFYEVVIKKITNETQWREGSNKSVLLIGDASPHGSFYKYKDRTFTVNWKEEALVAKQKNIIFDTLRINPYVTFYQELSDMTGGLCLPFSPKDKEKTSKVLEATSLARGGKNTEMAFMAMSESKAVKADATMDAVYGMYKNVVKK